MTTKQAPWAALPPQIMGGIRRVYDALQEMAAPDSGTAYFRKEDLAARSAVSSSTLVRSLRRLRDEGYVNYTPGNFGRLAEVTPASPEDGE